MSILFILSFKPIVIEAKQTMMLRGGFVVSMSSWLVFVIVTTISKLHHHV
jgi:hypothetical protein